MDNEDEKILHIGADLDADLVSEFRNQAKLRKFKIKEIVRRWIETWLGLDPKLQQDFYHANIQSEEAYKFLLAQAAAEDEAAAARGNSKQKRKSHRHKPLASA